MRKPVHVETGIWQTDSGEIANALYSFCDDGTMWELREDVWRRLPDIPQDEPGQTKGRNNVVTALRNLAETEKEYSEAHIKSGYGSINAGSYEWRNLRHAGDAARAILKRVDEKEEPQ